MSSLKALAAAKSRRSTGEQHIVSGTRPGTSIGSHAAFAPQNQMRQNPVRGGQPNMNQYQQQQIQQTQTNGLPFSKLTVSDAIGLITLRLGKVEQYLIDVQAEGGGFGNQGESNLPANTKLIDTSVLTSIVNRLDALEKREVVGGVSPQLQSQIAELTTKLDSVSKIERDLKDTREMLVNLMFKYELFTKEANTKFNDYENAILEVSQQIQSQTDVEPLTTDIGETEIDLESSVILSDDPDAEKILSAELKNMIKQELSCELESA